MSAASEPEPSADPAPTGALRVGTRTYLRLPRAEDYEAWVALRSASAEFLRPWEPAPPEGIDLFARSHFAHLLESRRTERCRRLFVLRRADGALLGAVNLNEIVRGVFQSAYAGYWIGVEHARRGYMSEALGLALDHAFRDLDLHRVEANVRPENAASLALVRRLGFRREGYSPRYLRIDGAWTDHERWAILREEWLLAGRAQAAAKAADSASATSSSGSTPADSPS